MASTSSLMLSEVRCSDFRMSRINCSSERMWALNSAGAYFKRFDHFDLFFKVFRCLSLKVKRSSELCRSSKVMPKKNSLSYYLGIGNS